MTNSKVRIGIIGAGGFTNTHMQHFQALDNVEVTAFARRNHSALDAMQQKWQVPHGFTDYRAMLSSGLIDAVDVITPTDSHLPITLDAIAAGLPVLCDKPLALTAPDCQKMLAAAEQGGVIHSTNFNQRGNTAVGRLKRYLDDGYVGTMHHTAIWWGLSMAEEDRKAATAWRFKPEHGGGVVHELIHVLDMARFIGGEVKRLVAKMDIHMKRRSFMEDESMFSIAVPDSAAYIVEWQQGGYAIVHCSFASKGTDANGESVARVEVSGSNGRIETAGRQGLVGSTGVSSPLTELDPGPAYPQPYERFVQAVQANDQSLIETSFYDGLKAAELVDAAYKSWTQGTWINLP